jgi:hypothetical protein
MNNPEFFSEKFLTNKVELILLTILLEILENAEKIFKKEWLSISIRLTQSMDLELPRESVFQ